MDGNYINFRRAKVGGFNKKDVINYIEKMRNDFYDYKKAVESTVDSLNAKIKELESLNEGVKSEEVKSEEFAAVKQHSGKDPISDINAAAIQLRTVADELCRNLSDFMSSVSHEGERTAFVDSDDEIEKDEEIVEDVITEKEPEQDKVSMILNSSANFSFVKGETVEAAEAIPEKKKSVLDCLSSSSFFN